MTTTKIAIYHLPCEHTTEDAEIDERMMQDSNGKPLGRFQGRWTSNFPCGKCDATDPYVSDPYWYLTRDER